MSSNNGIERAEKEDVMPHDMCSKVAREYCSSMFRRCYASFDPGPRVDFDSSDIQMNANV